MLHQVSHQSLANHIPASIRRDCYTFRFSIGSAVIAAGSSFRNHGFDGAGMATPGVSLASVVRVVGISVAAATMALPLTIPGAGSGGRVPPVAEAGPTGVRPVVVVARPGHEMATR